jgi:hypothetical protein
MSKNKKVWTDPVGSKLIAEGFKELIKWSWGALILPLYVLISGMVSKTSFLASVKQTWKSIVKFFIGNFQINFLTILLMLFGYILLTVLAKFIIRRFSEHSITKFTSANIWGADINWKWIKNKGKWKIKYGEYIMSCPTCLHNLKFDVINGQHYLSCRNIECNFRSGVYHFEPPSNVVILVDMDTYYFHNALISTVEAELRKRNSKK